MALLSSNEMEREPGIEGTRRKFTPAPSHRNGERAVVIKEESIGLRF